VIYRHERRPVALLSLVLSGCIPASKPTPADEVEQAPTARLNAFQETGPRATATVVVTRDRGLVLRPCYLALHINGTLAARLDIGETSLFYVPSGRVLLKATVDPTARGLCAMWHDEGSELQVAVGDKETRHFRLGTDSDGIPRLFENEGRRH
jgi:hypothetical protein